MKFFNDLEAQDNSFSLSNSITGSADASVSSTDSAELYVFSNSEFRGAKFIIQTITSSDYSIRELLSVHNGVDGYSTEYAIVGTSQELEVDEFDFYLNSSDAVLAVTPSTETGRNIKVHAVLLRNE